MSDTRLADYALADALDAVEAATPLVQHLTNEVTMNDVAQVTLHWGGLPVMSDTDGDAQEMVAGAGGVLLNTGRASPTEVEVMHDVGRKANDLGVPVVLDPVGAGATPTRRETAESLLDAVEFAAIKGNYGEVATLAGLDAEVRGVESVGEYDDVDAAASALASSTGAVVVASGAEDVVADGDRTLRISGGHERMGQIVGTGCMLGATLATFCGGVRAEGADGADGATELDDLDACLAGTLAFGLAGERAADLPHEGPASYRINFLDSVAGLDADDVAAVDVAERIERVD